jgi:hypothetical protein
MPHPASGSSIPLPGIYQNSAYVRSSPPPYFKPEKIDTMDPTTAQNDSNKQPPFVREGSGETERPPSAQRVNIDTTEQTTEEEGPIQEGEDELDSDVDPADMIEDFDWDHLYEEYHSQMDALSGEEATLMEEWVKLMHV